MKLSKALSMISLATKAGKTASGEFATVNGVVTVPSATYTQDPTTGAITTTPGVAVLTVTGTV